MFQFLIGTIQTQPATVSKSRKTVVSIPHRYDPNDKAGCRQLPEKRVSIPHRYDPNAGTPRSPSGGFCEFQFLIGTIQTGSDFESETEKQLFQFLIGTIQTRESHTDFFPAQEEFQFLIGTIQTLTSTSPGSKTTGVSIPHRYDPNAAGE